MASLIVLIGLAKCLVDCCIRMRQRRSRRVAPQREPGELAQVSLAGGCCHLPGSAASGRLLCAADEQGFCGAAHPFKSTVACLQAAGFPASMQQPRDVSPMHWCSHPSPTIYPTPPTPAPAATSQSSFIELAPQARTVAVPAVVVDPDGELVHMAFDDEPALDAAARAPVAQGGQQGSAPAPLPGAAGPDSNGASSLVQHVSCDIGHTVLSVADVSDLVAPGVACSAASAGGPALSPDPGSVGAERAQMADH